MSEVNGGRPRPRVPSEQGIEELRGRLRDSTARSAALAESNRQLAVRVAELERQLAPLNSLRDDELLAELPRRMRRALETAEEVAEEVVTRAKRRDDVLRERTEKRAAALMARADSEASAIMRRATADAVGRVNEAKSQAELIVRAARAQHDRVLSDLQEHAGLLEDRIRHLRREHHRLVQAYDVVERTMSEARAALEVPIVDDEPPVLPASPVRSRRTAGPSPALYTVRDRRSPSSAGTA